MRVASPEAVARFDFLEWMGADHLRHTKFVAMCDDKDPRRSLARHNHVSEM